MVIWLWTLAGLASAGAACAVYAALRVSVRTRAPAAPVIEPAREARETIDASGPRLPFREPEGERAAVVAANEGSADPVIGVLGFDVDATDRDGAVIDATPDWSDLDLGWALREEKPRSRRVMTPNGPMELTAPPFTLKSSIMTSRERWYARAISVRLPSGFVVCPKVRLESLLNPTPPNDRALDDWREWRKRVRMRSVDFLICRMPDWEPVVAVLIESSERSALSVRVDRMIDETLAEVGLPFVRCTGSPRSDWRMIAPYVVKNRSTA